MTAGSEAHRRSDCRVPVTLPPYALSAPVFRFRHLAALAGRAPIGGAREVALGLLRRGATRLRLLRSGAGARRAGARGTMRRREGMARHDRHPVARADSGRRSSPRRRRSADPAVMAPLVGSLARAAESFLDARVALGARSARGKTGRDGAADASRPTEPLVAWCVASRSASVRSRLLAPPLRRAVSSTMPRGSDISPLSLLLGRVDAVADGATPDRHRSYRISEPRQAARRRAAARRPRRPRR